MLTRLRLRNFKPWPDTGDLPLHPITGFFGANSSGKTSLLQALLLMKQTSESPDRSLVFHFGDHTTPADLGDFRSAVYRGASHMEISLDWDLEKPFEVPDMSRAGGAVISDSRLGFSVVVDRSEDDGTARARVREMSYRVGGARFGMRRVDENKKRDYELFSEGTDFQFKHNRGRPWRLEPVSNYGFPDQIHASFQNARFLADLELTLKHRLRSVFYLGPLRAQPRRRYIWAGADPFDMGRAGESVVAALLAARQREAKISPGHRKKRLDLDVYIAKWLRKLGLIHDFRIGAVGEGSQIFEVKVRKTPGAEEALITDVGFGVSQILPVLVLCFYVPKGSTVILEQPEIHLHPAVQSGLADVLIDVWKRRRVQILLESHSEHLLRRLQRRVAEPDSECGAEDIGLFFCENDDQGSRITPLELDGFGRIRNWPTDFFGDSFGEIAATALAGQQRRKAMPQ